MEKVKLTKEQAQLLEREKRDGYEKYQIVKRYSDVNGTHGRDFHLDELIKALYIGYEVENTYEVGDWVKVNWTDMEPTIHKVEKVIDNDRIVVDGEMKNKAPGMHIVEPATPEEIEKEKECRWWRKHHRDVWELENGDVLLRNDGTYVMVFNGNKVRGEYQLNILGTTGICYEVNKKILNALYKVICFADDRKDL